MTAPVRVFIIDDHPVVRAGLKELLRPSREIAIIGDAEDGGEATIERLDQTRPDVVVLDIRLKRGNGIDVCRDIKSHFPNTGVILLSAFWDEALVRQALDAKADGYLLKDAEHLDLRKSICSVARGESFFDPTIAGAIVRQLHVEEQQSSTSERDRSMLGLVARGHTNREIGAALFLSPHTVRDRLSEIMEQLGARNRTEAAQLAAQRGLI